MSPSWAAPLPCWWGWEVGTQASMWDREPPQADCRMQELRLIMRRLLMRPLPMHQDNQWQATRVHLQA